MSQSHKPPSSFGYSTLPTSLDALARAGCGPSQETRGGHDWIDPTLIPSWLTPFTLDSRTRFTRTPEALLRRREAPVPEAPPPEPEADAPSWYFVMDPTELSQDPPEADATAAVPLTLPLTLPGALPGALQGALPWGALPDPALESDAGAGRAFFDDAERWISSLADPVPEMAAEAVLICDPVPETDGVGAAIDLLAPADDAGDWEAAEATLGAPVWSEAPQEAPRKPVLRLAPLVEVEPDAAEMAETAELPPAVALASSVPADLPVSEAELLAAWDAATVDCPAFEAAPAAPLPEADALMFTDDMPDGAAAFAVPDDLPAPPEAAAAEIPVPEAPAPEAPAPEVLAPEACDRETGAAEMPAPEALQDTHLPAHPVAPSPTPSPAVASPAASAEDPALSAPAHIRRLTRLIAVGALAGMPAPASEQDCIAGTAAPVDPGRLTARFIANVWSGYPQLFGGEPLALTPAPVAETLAPQPAPAAPSPAPVAACLPAPAPAVIAPLAAPEPAALPADLGPAEESPYQLPSLELLRDPPVVEPDFELSEEFLDRNASMLGQILRDFGIRGEVIDANPGPVVTLYEFEPAPGIKSSRVIGLAADIARSMSAISARVAVVEGRNFIGIELPNRRRETVWLRELLTQYETSETKGKLGLCLGKTIGGEPVNVDLARMPHLLVAGTTGSGKSVAINTMILSLLYHHTPETCRLIMIDPKMLELSVYEGIPHLLTPVVTDPKKAIIALKWAVKEMEDRYRKMSRLAVRNIDGFNARVKDAAAKGEVIRHLVQAGFDKENGEPLFEERDMDLTPLPYIVVIVDEMADLMMVAGKEIEGAIQRLAQMARAAGIHLVMATQRPSVDVITGTIKANFPTRISFQVTSKIDSRTILGEMGAETLLGQGDMLYMAGGGRIARVHGPFVSDAEVEHVVAFLKAQGGPDYLDAVILDESEGFVDDDDAVFDKSDLGEVSGDLYEQAVAVVMRDRKASTSYIQRRLQVGYNKAASLMERMETEGIVGPANHAGKREILSFSRG